MGCEELRELLEEYALGALDEEDAARVESHLANCPDCPRLAAEYAQVVHSLPFALSSVSPWRLAPSVKNRLMQSLKIPESNRTPTAARPWFRLRTIAAIAAVVLIAVLVALTAQLSVALAQERVLRAEYANLVGQQELVLDVIDSNKTAKVALRATTGGSPSYGKVYTRPDMPYVVAMAARLNPPATGQAYHLWVTSQGKMILAGVMNVNAQGFGILIYKADRDGPTFESARLTLQPEGVNAPAGDTVLIWEATR